MKYFPILMRRYILLLLAMLCTSMASMAQKEYKVTFENSPVNVCRFTLSAVVVEGSEVVEEIPTKDYENGDVALIPEGYTVQFVLAKHSYDYELVKCTLNGTPLELNTNVYSFTMPAEDVTIRAEYVFDPGTIPNPGVNSYDRATGSLYVDEIFSGDAGTNAQLYLSKYNISREDVKSLTMCGDFTPFGYFRLDLLGLPNVETIDFGNIAGVDSLRLEDFYPGFVSDEMPRNLRSIVLPACIKTYRARMDRYSYYYEDGEEKMFIRNLFQHLDDLTLLAPTPPVLDPLVLPEGFEPSTVLYVPAASVELYQQSPWVQCAAAILPIRDDVAEVTLTLPAECSDGRYSNMTLELVNKKSGQRTRYVTSRDLTYIFPNAIKHSAYEAYLRTSTGVVVGRIPDIVIDEDNVSRSFEELVDVQNVRLEVLDTNGKVCTKSCNISWYTADGTPLGQGERLQSQPVSAFGSDQYTELRYTVHMPSADYGALRLPIEGKYVMEPSVTHLVSLQLEPRSRRTVSGVVTDHTTDAYVSGVRVSAGQSLPDGTVATINATTDAKGAFSFDVIEGFPLDVTADVYGYSTSRKTVTDFEAPIDLTVKPLLGNTIRLDLQTKGFSDSRLTSFAGLQIAVRNETLGTDITDFTLRYPEIVLTEPVNDGDVLSVTLTDVQPDAPYFATATERVTVDGLNLNLSVTLKEKATLYTSFSESRNTNNVAILFDADGNIVRRADCEWYFNSELSGLDAGTYTLVAMGTSNLTTGCSCLADLDNMGFVADVDYAIATVNVADGDVTYYTFTEIPLFDTRKFQCTAPGSTLSLNKTSVVAGNFLTLNTRLEMREEYANIRDVKLIYDLPFDATFVDGSVMEGTNIIDYTIEGQRLIIPVKSYSALDRTSDRVRFCFVPTQGGDYEVSASVQFRRNGEDIQRSIGTVAYTSEAISMRVPDVLKYPTFTASGAAPSGSRVHIYDSESVIGSTTVPSNGFWSVRCALPDTTNLSIHRLRAQISTSAGANLSTETTTVHYDRYAMTLSKVDMTFVNIEYNWLRLAKVASAPSKARAEGIDYSDMSGEYLYEPTVVTFDFLNPDPQPLYYFYHRSTEEYDFNIYFTEDRPDDIADIDLYVRLRDDSVFIVKPTYDLERHVWTAHAHIEGVPPVTVAVEFTTKSNTQIFDASAIRDAHNAVRDFQQSFTAGSDEANQYAALIRDEINKMEFDETPDWGQIAEWDAAYRRLLGLSSTNPYNDLSMEDLEKVMAELDYEREEQGADKIDFSVLFNTSFEDVAALAEYADRYTVGTAEGYDPEQLLAMGYEELHREDGTVFYFLVADGSISCVDFVENRSFTYRDEEMASNLRGLRAKVGEVEGIKAYIAELGRLSNELKGHLDRVAALADEIFKIIDGICKNMDSTISNLDKQLAQFEKWRVAGDYRYSWNNVKAANLKRWMTSRSLETFQEGRSLAAKLKVGNQLGRLLGIYSLISDAVDAYKDLSRTQTLYESIPDPCDYDNMNALELRERVLDFGLWGGAYLCSKISSDIASLIVTIGSIGAAVESGGVSLLGLLLTVGQMAYTYFGDEIYSSNRDKLFAEVPHRIRLLRCYDRNNDPSKHPVGWYKPYANPADDPSGYVYEAVPSNRVEGVTATLYYREEYVDMYGDVHDKSTQWRAEEFGQENPLFTNSEGYYRWDVPQGLWQVAYEKEGYVATRSEWLPVPPPQLDVNVSLVQMTHPVVARAHVYADGAEVMFDKYMQPATLTADNIHLRAVRGEEATLVPVSIRLLDEEASVPDTREGQNVPTYASRILVAPAAGFDLGAYDKATLIISSDVIAYNDLHMQTDYSQTLLIEQRITDVRLPGTVEVAMGDVEEVPVQFLPVGAAAGRTVAVALSDTENVTLLSSQSVTLDANGQTTVSLAGRKLGTAFLDLKVMEQGAQSTVGEPVESTGLVQYSYNVPVRVFDPTVVPAPVASPAAGAILVPGTAVTLKCANTDATIYYTLDGSCPCEVTPSRHVYDGTPLVLQADTHIRAMAVGPDGTESDVADFYYVIEAIPEGIVKLAARPHLLVSHSQGQLRVTLPEGSPDAPVLLVNAAGRCLQQAKTSGRAVTFDTADLPAGTYIVVARTAPRAAVSKVVIK